MGSHNRAAMAAFILAAACLPHSGAVNRDPVPVTPEPFDDEWRALFSQRRIEAANQKRARKEEKRRDA